MNNLVRSMFLVVRESTMNLYSARWLQMECYFIVGLSLTMVELCLFLEMRTLLQIVFCSRQSTSLKINCLL